MLNTRPYLGVVAFAVAGCVIDGGSSDGADGTDTTDTDDPTDPTNPTDPTDTTADSSGGDPDDTGTDTEASDDVAFTVTLENISPTPPFTASGVFDTPVGAPMPEPLAPGESYQITFTAAPGYPARAGDTRVTFASMFVPSNDLFFAPGPEGIDLFDADGTPRNGDVTAEVMVWDAGSELDEPLNGTMEESPNQKPHQGMEDEDVGDADPVDMVRLADETYPGEIPDIDTLLAVTLTSALVDGATQFTLTITNESQAGTLPGTGAFNGAVPVSPGVFAVYDYEEGAAGPLFTPGEPDRDEGVDDIAEDGFPMRLHDAAVAKTGLRTVSSPGAWAVHDAGVVFFSEGVALEDTGLEAIAEDGEVASFVTTLQGLAGVQSSGQVGEMPLPPGMSVTIDLTARPGDLFSFATMFVPSNDLLFATDPGGVALFDGDGVPFSGEITDEIALWDAGTEINQEPGVGMDQVHLQAGPNTGAADPDDTVRPVDDGYTYPAVADVLRVTIEPAR